MDVDEISNDNVETLTRRTLTTKEAHLRRIFAVLDEDDAQDRSLTEGLTRRSAIRTAIIAPAEQSGAGPEQELIYYRRLAEKGDAGSARRVAELLELLEQETEAVVWWHRAADAGDLDAIYYIQGFRPA